MSYPMTSKFEESLTAKGRPTYPKPTTTIFFLK